jgi:hypothetical protein
MRIHTASRLAWSMWFLAALPPLVLTITLGRGRTSLSDIFVGLGFISLQLAFSTVGALVASRRPNNPIGWLFCFEGVALSLTGASEEYASRALADPAFLPLGELAAWVATWAGSAPILGPLIFVFLLFPDGRLPSRRWLAVSLLAGVGLALALLVTAFAPGPLESSFEIDNPFGVRALRSVLPPLFAPSFFVILGTLFASVVSMALRLRRSRGQERQQLKWFASAAAILGIAFVVGPITWMIPTIPEVVWQVTFVLAVGALPLSAGIAILRYRLYDIDLIINRTLVYGVLSTVLALVYVGGVVGLGGLVRAATGEGSNDLVIVASTLAVAALFRPARSRVQNFIDRRFYRRKYDAVRTLEAFSASIREQVSLEALTADLQAVVRHTMQPAHVSLWLKQQH